MKFKWRKWNRVIHRDFGYFFCGLTIIYSLSGIAINHKDDWNPNYNITYTDINVSIPSEKEKITKSFVLNLLDQFEEKDRYKKHYFPRKNRLKIFLKRGNIEIDLDTGNGYIERIKKRPVFWESNFLHYNPVRWWTFFSDIFAGALIIISITGLFILKGKNGIKSRGAWLTIAGLIIPIVCLIIYG